MTIIEIIDDLHGFAGDIISIAHHGTEYPGVTADQLATLNDAQSVLHDVYERINEARLSTLNQP